MVSLYDARCNKATSFLKKDESNDHIIESLHACKQQKTLTTFNGTSYDFKIMCNNLDHPSDKKTAARLGLSSYDIMLDFACHHGYFSSLDSFADATLKQSKTASGGDVCQMWSDGKQKEVAEYCENDARLTAMLYAHGRSYGRLKRKTKSGKTTVWALPSTLFRTACQALKEYETNPPDTAWMQKLGGSSSQPSINSMADWAVDILSP